MHEVVRDGYLGSVSPAGPLASVLDISWLLHILSPWAVYLPVLLSLGLLWDRLSECFSLLCAFIIWPFALAHIFSLFPWLMSLPMNL